MSRISSRSLSPLVFLPLPVVFILFQTRKLRGLVMKRTQSEYVTSQPSRRPLKIFASDPMLGRTAGNRLTIDVANENLGAGPTGKRYFMEPTNEDVLAFHEGFSDIVALFQHFSFKEILRQQIQKSRTDLRSNTLLVQLARQFGYATGAGKALRSALDKPEAKLYKTTYEPHLRGSILVAAVFDAYFATYQRRIRDLVRIATGGSGELPSGDLHPDLVNRIAAEASATAQQILTMCMRAFDYLPPVDITFGDYLRALVTADYELVPDDEFGERGAMIEAFRLRGIYPENVASLAEESLLWENADPGIPGLPLEGLDMLQELFFAAADFGNVSAPWSTWGQSTSRSGSSFQEADSDMALTSSMAQILHQYAEQNRQHFHLSEDPTIKIEVHGFHPVFRVAPNGQLLIELVAQFAQTDRSKVTELGGLPLRGGTTLVASANGKIRYVISKPLPSANLEPGKQKEAQARLERQRTYLKLTDLADPKLSYASQQQIANRMRLRMNLASLHQGVS